MSVRFTMTLVAFAALSALSCSSSSSTVGATDLSHFTGPTWSGSETISVNCSGTVTNNNIVGKWSLQASGTSGLTYSSTSGCTYDFAVVGDTATLTNAPVVCSGTSATGAAVISTYEHYTLTTSDGVHLTGSNDGTLASGGTNCTFNHTISATR